MRQIALITTVAAVFVVASPAYATINEYSATYTFTSHKAGTARKPQPIGFTEVLKIQSATPGDRSGVLLNTTNTIYGVRIDERDFPRCTIAEITAAQNDTVCPRRAKLASGYINAVIGNETNFAVPGAACDPAVDFWNAGPGKLAVFNVANPRHQCLGGQLHTGAVPPYSASYRMQGKNLVIKNSVPDTVSFPLGLTGGLVGSVEMEHVVWSSQTATMKGRHVASISSVGCRGSRRPVQTTFTATLPPAGPTRETKALRSSAPC